MAVGWTRLGQLNDPSNDILDEGTEGRDWSEYLAQSLRDFWDGRSVVLPLHREERKQCNELARKIDGFSRARGYALMAALRYFWRHEESGIESCAKNDVWMTPTEEEE